MPVVSALLPVRNAASVLSRSLGSILDQRFDDFELLVIDDGSTDRTLDLVGERAARDPRVKIIRNERRLGLGASLNRGAAAARGEFLARVEPDAHYSSDRFADQVEWLRTHPATALVGGCGLVVTAEGFRERKLVPPSDYEGIRQALLAGEEAIVPATLMGRRPDLEGAGLFSTDPAIESQVDRELVVRLAARCRVENIWKMMSYVLPRAGEGDVERSARRAVDVLAQQLLSEPMVVRATRARADGRRIFVLLTAYNDRGVHETIACLLDHAARATEIVVGLCAVYDGLDGADWATASAHQSQVRVVCAHVNESRGASWARHLAARMWSGEDYVLQVDADARLQPQWDDRLIAALHACRSPFPVLTNRAAASHFAEDGSLLVARASPSRAGAPTPQTVLGGFLFADSTFLQEVTPDPSVFETNPEFTRMVRAWTAGWDFFALPAGALAIEAAVRAAPPGWTPPRRGRLEAIGRQRSRHLLGLATTSDVDALAGLGAYGLGNRRTVGDYERFAGVDLGAETVSALARTGRPNPRFAPPPRTIAREGGTRLPRGRRSRSRSGRGA